MRIYVPSYKRADKIKTYHTLNKQCCYVVRKSEEQLYLDAGINKNDLLAVEDEKINSFPKVRQYIIDYAKSIGEDVIVQMDDDIQGFKYLYENNIKDVPQDMIVCELERVAQILYDLNLGFASFPMTIDVRKYNKPFQFKGTIGGVCIYNLSCLKGRYDKKLRYKCDIDFQLQELLKNRIILQTCYFTFDGKYDTNKGGNTTTKNAIAMQENKDYLRTKWGKHIDFNDKSNTIKLDIKR